MLGWGASVESISESSRICCPLKYRSACYESLNINNLMDHLNEQHKGPIIHFYKKKFTMPIPFPFQEDAVYIIHEKNEIFILQVGTIYYSI